MRIVFECSSLDVYQPQLSGRKQTQDMLEELHWQRVWIPEEELEEVAAEKDIGAALLTLLSPQ